MTAASHALVYGVWNLTSLYRWIFWSWPLSRNTVSLPPSSHCTLKGEKQSHLNKNLFIKLKTSANVWWERSHITLNVIILQVIVIITTQVEVLSCVGAHVLHIYDVFLHFKQKLQYRNLVSSDVSVLAPGWNWRAAANVLCVVELEWCELQLQVEAALC